MKEIKPSDARRISGGGTRLEPDELGLDPLPSPLAEPNDIEQARPTEPTGVAPRPKVL